LDLSDAPSWVQVLDRNGMAYFLDTQSGAVQWEAPDDLLAWWDRTASACGETVRDLHGERAYEIQWLLLSCVMVEGLLGGEVVGWGVVVMVRFLGCGRGRLGGQGGSRDAYRVV
jgi:hypothetical protein